MKPHKILQAVDSVFLCGVLGYQYTGASGIGMSTLSDYSKVYHTWDRHLSKKEVDELASHSDLKFIMPVFSRFCTSKQTPYEIVIPHEVAIGLIESNPTNKYKTFPLSSSGQKEKVSKEKYDFRRIIAEMKQAGNDWWDDNTVSISIDGTLYQGSGGIFFIINRNYIICPTKYTVVQYLPEEKKIKVVGLENSHSFLEASVKADNCSKGTVVYVETSNESN